MPAPSVGHLHHVELWVPDLTRAVAQWGWLLGELGYREHQDWQAGHSWRLGPTYLVVEHSPDLLPGAHSRRAAGLNHLAFHGGGSEAVDRLMEAGPARGWRPLFADRYPYAGGPEHYAGYLENSDGFEVELVATGLGGAASSPVHRLGP